ncbi:MAG: restriction endonuclease subunit S [Lachnospiraceae bacterium]
MLYNLEELFDLQMGKTPSRNNLNYWNTKDNKWISIGDLSQSGKYIYETKEYLSNIAVAESGIKKIPANTVIMSFKLSIGKVAITKEDIYSNEAIMAFHDKHTTELLPEYIYYLFKYKDWNASTNKAVMGKTLNKTTLSQIKIDICSIQRQQKIVGILNKVSEILDNIKEQISSLDNIIKFRFIEMFGYININNKGWDVQPLGKLCTIVRGSSPRPIEKYLGGEIPWIKIGDATDSESIYLHSTKEHIILDGVKKSRMVKAGSLIFANCGVSLGFARIITFDGCIHDGWLAMEDVDSSVDKVFLLQSLNQMTKHFREIAPAGTQPNLNTTIMKGYMQVIPPMKLQKEFISFIEQINKLKATQQKNLEKAQLLFDSLMQQYFG